MASDIIVLKFGSSILRRGADMPTAVHEIYRWYRAGWRVITVVSAIGDCTERLLNDVRDLSNEPEPHATAELLATGERHSAALLGIALDRAGVPARVVDPREIQLTASGTVLDSEPVAADRERVEAMFRESPVLVVPGFFGYSTNGRLHLLGRGGSDLSAVYLASALQANRCRLVKDVDGVYEADPALAGSTPLRRFAALGYAEAIERAAPLIQPKAVHFLERCSASAEVAGVASSYESTIGRFDCALAEPNRTPPLSVLLLGLGTVGFGVYQRIAAMPAHFRVIGVLVRDRAKHAANGVPADLLYESPGDLANVHADIVVDALPRLEPSHTLVRQFLTRGVRVVSSNTTLIADAGPDLSLLAARKGAQLLYSATVGGSTPMLEALRRETQRGKIRSIAGILNGTCNYVLDRCVEGLLLNEATRAAYERGFAEADPLEDLSGRDAARKLQILARHAFGQGSSTFEVQPLNSATVLRMRAALRVNQTLRVIARGWQLHQGVFGRIQLEAIDASDAFAQTAGEWNRLVITRASGEDVVVRGRGAGRWPSTEAIIADLLEVRFARLGLPPAVPSISCIARPFRSTDLRNFAAKSKTNR